MNELLLWGASTGSLTVSMGTCHVVLVGGIPWGGRPLVAVYQDMLVLISGSLPRHAGLFVKHVAVYQDVLVL